MCWRSVKPPDATAGSSATRSKRRAASMRVAVSVSDVICSETVLSGSNAARSARMTASSAATTNMRKGLAGASSATTLNRSLFGSGLIVLGLPGETKACRDAGVGIDGIVGCNELQGNTVRDRQDCPPVQVEVVDQRAVAHAAREQQVVWPVVGDVDHPGPQVLVVVEDGLL